MAASGCGTAGKQGAPTAAPTTTTRTQSTPTATEAAAEPAPLTRAERRWLVHAGRLSKRMGQLFGRNGEILTEARMQSYASTFHSCARLLKQAGPVTDRLAGVERLIGRACRRFDRAGDEFERAVAASNAYDSGAFDHAIDQAFESAGNGTNDLIQAAQRAKRVRARAGD